MISLFMADIAISERVHRESRGCSDLFAEKNFYDP